MKFPGKTIFFAVLFAGVLASTVPAAAADHYLIADQFNNRVIEVDHQGNMVWHFGLGPADFSPASIIGVNDAQRVGEFTLMAGTGTPGGQPEAPNCTNSSGCPDNRVILVDHAGNIVWQYGQFGRGGQRSESAQHPRAEHLASQPPCTDHRSGEPAHHRGRCRNQWNRLAIWHHGRFRQRPQSAQQPELRRAIVQR